MSFETIIVESKDAVGSITLNRPASMNAVCAAMLYELVEALKQFEADESIRAVVLKGSDSFFAAGTDMSEFASQSASGFVKDGLYGQVAEILSSFKKPIVTAVAGYAFGGGLELVLMSDVVIAADNARFGFPEITLGVLPQLGGVSLLTNRVGRAKAMDILLTGRHISAEEALACGIISRIVDAGDVLEEAFETAARIAAMPAAGVQLVKQAVAEVGEKLKFSEKNIAKLSLMSVDAQEGLSALKENRAPNFVHK